MIKLIFLTLVFNWNNVLTEERPLVEFCKQYKNIKYKCVKVKEYNI